MKNSTICYQPSTIYRRGFTHALFSRKNSAGFTLIELLIVIAIIGILSALLMANFIGVRQRARDGVRKSDLRQIQSALELYRSDKGGYPSSPLATCGEPLTDGDSDTVVTYMQKIPCDPSTGAIYAYSSSGNTYSIIACLENGNDSQVDKSAGGATNCSDSTTLWRYTLQNP